MSVGVARGSNDAEAPEGGWGYLVVFCLSVSLIATFSYVACLGILFSEFLEDLGHHTKALTMLPSFFFMCVSTVGLFAKYLFNRYSLRSVAIFGGTVFCCGSMMIVFVRSLNELLVAYSLMQGVGFGLVMPAMYTTFIKYFVKKRVMMMSLVGALQGIAAVGMPLFMEMLLKEYGFRGCMAILAALNLHVLLGTITLHPVEWHQDKSTKLSRDESLVKESDTLLEPQTLIKSPNSVWKKVVDFLDLSLFLNPVYTNICIGISLTFGADVAFVTIMSSYLREIAFSKDATAQIMSIGMAADVASRFLLTAFSSPLNIKARPLFLSGAIGTIVVLLAFMYFKSYTAVLVIKALLGFFRAWTHIPVSLVFADFLPPERFPSGYGLYMFIQGFTLFAMGPFIGWTRDISQSYLVAFGMVIMAMVLCVISWSIEMLVTHYQKRKCRSSIADVERVDQ